MAAANPLLGVVISEKLLKNNHVVWNAQILAAVREARLMGHLAGVTKAPEEYITTKTGNEEARPSTRHMKHSMPQINKYLASCCPL